MVDVVAAFHHLLATTADCGDGGQCDTGLPAVNATGGQLRIILQLVIGILAAVAVLLVTIGGFRYVLSDGDPEKTKKARSTIIYAIVGLIIAMSAELIVSFAVGKL